MNSDLREVAKHVVWFKQPDDALKDTKLFLTHVMTFGTLREIRTVLATFPRKTSTLLELTLSRNLRSAPLGLLERALSSRASSAAPKAQNSSVNERILASRSNGKENKKRI